MRIGYFISKLLVRYPDLTMPNHDRTQWFATIVIIMAFIIIIVMDQTLIMPIHCDHFKVKVPGRTRVFVDYAYYFFHAIFFTICH